MTGFQTWKKGRYGLESRGAYCEPLGASIEVGAGGIGFVWPAGMKRRWVKIEAGVNRGTNRHAQYVWPDHDPRSVERRGLLLQRLRTPSPACVRPRPSAGRALKMGARRRHMARRMAIQIVASPVVSATSSARDARKWSGMNCRVRCTVYPKRLRYAYAY